MLTSPHRLSLVAQTAVILKEHISSLPKGERLPSERELCRELGISRVTLRSALAKLEGEGMIRGSRGSRRQITVKRRNLRQSRANREVVILSPVPLQSVEARVLFWIDELRDALAKEGCKLDILSVRNCYSRHPQRTLEELAARHRPAAWLLYLSTPAMQKWFFDRGLPAIISGSRYEGVRLPSLDVDYRATCRHAVGKFLACGHRCLVLLNPQSVAAGDLDSESGFQEAGAAAGRDADTIISRHNGTVDDICANLDRLLQRPVRPTAFLVSRPPHALTTLGHLIQRGLRFPAEAALIARDHDSFLEHVVPSVARYQADPTLFARKLSRLVVEILAGGGVRPMDHRIFPCLIPGQTLK